MFPRLRPAALLRLRQVLATAALAAALLACGLLPTGTSPTPAPAVPTNTPFPATATPAPTSPSPTASPTRVERAETATPAGAGSIETALTPVALAPDPAFDKVRSAILGYLEASAGAIDGLAAVVEDSGMAPAGAAAQQASGDEKVAFGVDLDGDGVDEAVVIVQDQTSTSVFGSGAVFIVDKPVSGYTIAYDSTVQLGATGAVTLLSTDDVNGDSLPDLSFTTQSCGAHTCYSVVSVVSFQDSAYVDLSQGVSSAYPDLIALRDESGDSRLEIVIHGGTYGSVGAGPQRAATYIYALSAGRYALAAVRHDASDLIYFTIVDANAALADGKADEAVALYRQAAGSQALRASGEMLNGMTEAEEADALRSFARFRLVVAATLAGDDDAAEAALADAHAAGGLFAPLADAYWTAYSESADVEDGCTAVAQLAAEDPAYLDVLNAFGYANPTFADVDVCRGTGTVQ